MVQPGDNVIFPTVDTSSRGNKYVSKTVKEFETRENGGEGLFESVVGENKDYITFENGDEVPFSEIGQKMMGADVTNNDVFVRPSGTDSNLQNGADARDDINPQRIHEERSMRSRVADESKDAEITTDESKWASAPDQYDYPGVDTGPKFESTFEGPFDDF